MKNNKKYFLSLFAIPFLMLASPVSAEEKTVVIKGDFVGGHVYLNGGYANTAMTYTATATYDDGTPLVYSYYYYEPPAVVSYSVSVYDANGDEVLTREKQVAPGDYNRYLFTNQNYYSYGDVAYWLSSNSQGWYYYDYSYVYLYSPIHGDLITSFDPYPVFNEAPTNGYFQFYFSSASEYLNGYGRILSITPEITDTDGDGINDDLDFCPASDLSDTVVVGTNDSGVTNHLNASGCTITDEINACRVEGQNHGQFVSCVSDVTNSLKDAGVISGKEKGKIQSAAARSK
ncbi:hypothetical protein [Pseudidiomarina sp.]|uniref:hypothetical protein n=1 Tax=Pseudidiomarina sp. TaxID=2081707 RepID=UPI00299D612E|nr:hypothetical protein [Pseudidiomarina sp.]MDX1705669.1 hypothetical protein [Pseudidiomarina sp.]